MSILEKIRNINLFTSLLQMKLFLRNNIAFAKKCTVEESISCTIFLQLSGCVQKQPFGGAPQSMFYYMMRKTFKNSSREVHFLVRAQFTGLQCWYKWTCSLVFFNVFNYFRKLFIVVLRFSKHLFKNILGWLLPYAISNQTKANFATCSTWFLFI